MNPIAFLAGVVAIGAVAVWLIRKNKQVVEERNLQFGVHARHLGWRFELNSQYSKVLLSSQGVMAVRSEGQDISFQFEGNLPQGAWRMWNDEGLRFADSTDGGTHSSAQSSAVWVCEDLHAPAMSVLILPRAQYRIEHTGAFAAVSAVVGAFTSVVTDQPEDTSRRKFIAQTSEFQGARPALREHFAVLSAPMLPVDWLSGEIQDLILQWPVGSGKIQTGRALIEVNFGPRGLRIAVQRPLSGDWAFWEHLGRLGIALASSLGRR